MSSARRAALELVLRAERVEATWFARDFLRVFDREQINAVLVAIRAAAGPFHAIEERADGWYAIFERAESLVQISLDEDRRITLLSFAPLRALATTLDASLSELAIGNAQLSYVIFEDDRCIAERVADRVLPVGSTFKLAVLAALRTQIDSGLRAWSDVFPLDETRKSLPSGPYRAWPHGTPITLATYAAQMISVSDNTATDMLIEIVGRDALVAISGRNAPFISTREMFALKAARAAELRARWRAGDASVRVEILATLAGVTPRIEDVVLDPADCDIEWHFSVRELCALMTRVEDLEVMTIEPGFATPSFARIAYKGGSDAGVLNFTVCATTASGVRYRASATWNDPKATIDERAATVAFASVLEQLGRRGN